MKGKFNVVFFIISLLFISTEVRSERYNIENYDLGSCDILPESPNGGSVGSYLIDLSPMGKNSTEIENEKLLSNLKNISRGGGLNTPNSGDKIFTNKLILEYIDNQKIYYVATDKSNNVTRLSINHSNKYNLSLDGELSKYIDTKLNKKIGEYFYKYLTSCSKSESKLLNMRHAAFLVDTYEYDNYESIRNGTSPSSQFQGIRKVHEANNYKDFSILRDNPALLEMFHYLTDIKKKSEALSIFSFNNMKSTQCEFEIIDTYPVVKNNNEYFNANIVKCDSTNLSVDFSDNQSADKLKKFITNYLIYKIQPELLSKVLLSAGGVNVVRIIKKFPDSRLMEIIDCESSFACTDKCNRLGVCEQ